MQRKVIGDPKAGLTLRILQTPTTITLQALPDPLMLYIVLAAAMIAGVIGALASSPAAGVVSFLTLVLIFSPLICVLAFNALRVRSMCLIDLERDLVRIDEQSYTRRFQAVYPLDQVEGVIVHRMPSGPLSGGWAFGLFIALRDADYMAAWSNNEASVRQDAWLISRFLDIPLETPTEGPPKSGRSRKRVVMTTALLYLLPIVLAISALVFVSHEMPGVTPTLAGFLGAVVISQIGAILAVAYYRMRRPYET